MSLQRAPEVVYEILEDRAVLVHPNGQELMTLNPTATRIWEALDEPAELDDLVARLATDHSDVPTDRLQRDVAHFIEELRRDRLVVQAQEADS